MRASVAFTPYLPADSGLVMPLVVQALLFAAGPLVMDKYSGFRGCCQQCGYFSSIANTLLCEDYPEMFTVYKITGEMSPMVYIGYCEGDDPLKSFTVGGKRPDDERKDVQFMELQGGAVTAHSLLQYETEYDAFMERNRLRGYITESFTAPSIWPTAMWSRMDSTSKEALGKQISQWNLWHMPTARAAYEEGLWNMNDLRPAREKHGKQCIIDALLTLSPLNFHLQHIAPYR